jgi:hypothetical protein
MTTQRKAAPLVRQHERRPVTTIAGKEPIAMTIQQIIQTELTLSERERLDRDVELLKHLGAGAHLDEWLSLYDGLAIRRRLAMRIAHANRPEGKGYALAMSQLYTDAGVNVKDKALMTSLGAVLWIGDKPEHVTILREMREAMTPGERSRLNSPISARQRVEKVLKERERGTEEQVKDSPVTMLRRRVAELERALAEEQAKLAKYDGGSLFDLKNDSADDIVSAMLTNISTHKADAIAKGLADGVKRKRQRPAG